MGHSLPLFPHFRLFYLVYLILFSIENEIADDGIRTAVLRDRSTNCATTTGRVGLHVLIHLLTVPVIYGAYYDTKHGWCNAISLMYFQSQKQASSLKLDQFCGLVTSCNRSCTVQIPALEVVLWIKYLQCH